LADDKMQSYDCKRSSDCMQLDYMCMMKTVSRWKIPAGNSPLPRSSWVSVYHWGTWPEL